MVSKGSDSKRASSSSSKHKHKTISLATSCIQPANKKLRSLSSLALNPPIFTIDGLGDSGSQSVSKGKGKALEKEPEQTEDDADRLWVDVYAPSTEADLAVHKRKVDDVRRWLLEAFDGGLNGKLRRYRRILALTGPSGTGKTTTLRVLSRELGFEIIEWKNAIDERFPQRELGTGSGDESEPNSELDMEYEALMDKFQTFMTRASTVQQSIFSTSVDSNPVSPKHRLILLEDLPNILHPGTRARFHATLEALVSSPAPLPVPVVIILSDLAARGEDGEGELGLGGRAWGRDKEVADLRGALGPKLTGSQWVREIRFNPIAPTLLRRALISLLTIHSKRARQTLPFNVKEVVELVTESSNGDIRSAINSLQFACLDSVTGHKRPGRNKGKSRDVVLGGRALLEAVTRREAGLALFHLVGKVLYNKRKGDPPSARASKADLEKEAQSDRKLADEPPLPLWLEDEGRRRSRVDVEALYADSPIDASLLGLYVHQNYTQFCERLDECEGVADWLSWVDSSGGEAWYQTNPHQFHLVTLGTLHSLPSPVPRRSQKIYKPEFFESLRRAKEGEEAVEDVERWLGSEEGLSEPLGVVCGREIVTELGGLLKARDVAGGPSAPPPTHRAFSSLVFRRGEGSSAQLDENDMGVDAEAIPDSDQYDSRRGALVLNDVGNAGGWLEEDDIEED